MKTLEIKEEFEHSGDLKVKVEENLLSVVYEVYVTSKVDIKPKEEFPLQSILTSDTNEETKNEIEVQVKPEQNPGCDELEFEPESKSIFHEISDIDSEDDSNEEHSQEIPQNSHTSKIRSNQNVSKKKKGSVKIQKSQLLECTLCARSFPSVGFLITHTRKKHATIKNPGSKPITENDSEASSNCPMCSKSLTSVRSLQSHFLYFHIERTYQCSICLKNTNEIRKFPTQAILNAHMKQVHDPGRFEFQCDICSKKFASLGKYNCHKNTHTEMKYKCEYCSKTYRKKETMLRHIIAVHKEYTDRHETFKCEECEQLFCSKSDLNGHVFQTHVKKTVQCKICFRKFMAEGDLNRHLTVAHWEIRTRLVCDVCSKVFNNDKDLGEHLEVEHKRFFKCQKCFKSFVSKQEYHSHSKALEDKGRNAKKAQWRCRMCLVFLNTECAFTTHKETHLNPSEIQRKIITRLNPDDPRDCLMKCDFCSKTFVQKSLLLDHARKCHPNRKLKCKWCEKSFQVKFQLNKHELLHFTNKVFKCQVCHKGFDYLHNLKLHEGIHKIDKKYKCSQCKNSFAVNQNLQNHIANHHGDAKPFKCDICKKSFALQSKLVAHSVVHRDKKPFSCSKCSYSCKRLNNLKRHQRTVHAENPTSINRKRMSRPARLGPHLKYFKNLVYVCSVNECAFETKDAKEVAIHYAKHMLPKVILPRLLYGPSSAIFLSKSTSTNKHAIQARYKCTECFIALSSANVLRKHRRICHNEKTTKRKKKL